MNVTLMVSSTAPALPVTCERLGGVGGHVGAPHEI
jgi:hypothetical protein